MGVIDGAIFIMSVSQNIVFKISDIELTHAETLAVSAFMVVPLFA